MWVYRLLWGLGVDASRQESDSRVSYYFIILYPAGWLSKGKGQLRVLSMEVKWAGGYVEDG